MKNLIFHINYKEIEIKKQKSRKNITKRAHLQIEKGIF